MVVVKTCEWRNKIGFMNWESCISLFVFKNMQKPLGRCGSGKNLLHFAADPYQGADPGFCIALSLTLWTREFFPIFPKNFFWILLKRIRHILLISLSVWNVVSLIELKLWGPDGGMCSTQWHSGYRKCKCNYFLMNNEPNERTDPKWLVIFPFTLMPI